MTSIAVWYSMEACSFSRGGIAVKPTFPLATHSSSAYDRQKGDTMRKMASLLAASALLILCERSIAQEHHHRFDGKWQTTVSCEPSRGALGFSYRFLSTVKDGNFYGLRGTEGEPSSLLIDGTISENGVGRLYAAGKTGSKEFVP